MNEKIISEGKCLFCNKSFRKAGINRHLEKHLEEKALNTKPGKSFLIKIETNPKYGNFQYFLSLWVDGEAKMKDLDNFLRNIWLECCGHLSAFNDPSKRRKNTSMFDFFEAKDVKGKILMSRKTKEVLFKDFKIEYEYDFGSTTALLITVLQEYSVKADNKIVLLSRNEPLPILCEECGKSVATEVCAVHNWEENSLFCEKCARKHANICEDFEDYAAMPIVNSPRFGICGYTGGTIDKKRDGVFQED